MISNLLAVETTLFLNISLFLHFQIFQHIIAITYGHIPPHASVCFQRKFASNHSCNPVSKKLSIDWEGANWIHTSLDDSQSRIMWITSSAPARHLEQIGLSHLQALVRTFWWANSHRKVFTFAALLTAKSVSIHSIFLPPFDPSVIHRPIWQKNTHWVLAIRRCPLPHSIGRWKSMPNLPDLHWTSDDRLHSTSNSGLLPKICMLATGVRLLPSCLCTQA